MSMPTNRVVQLQQPIHFGQIERTDAYLGQTVICGGSKGNGKSSIESAGGTDSAGAPKKSWAQWFFEGGSKLWCIGVVFRTVAGWFNIPLDDNSNNPGGADRVTQTKSKREIERVFSKKEPNEKQIKKAREAFTSLSLSGKLAAIQHLLKSENCTGKVAFNFIKLLGSNLNKLKEYVKKELGDDSELTPDQALKKCKSSEDDDAIKAVRRAVAAYLEKVQDKADGQKCKLIRETFNGKNLVDKTSFQKALDAFKKLEYPVSQMDIFLELLSNGNISDRQRAEFAAALPGGTTTRGEAADDSGGEAEEVSQSTGKKSAKAKKKEEVESEDEESGEIQREDLQGRLVTLIKEARRDVEAELTATHKAAMKGIKAYKAANKGKLPIDRETGKPAEMPPELVAYKTLRKYVDASAAHFPVRQTIRDQATKLLRELQNEQGGNDAEDSE